MQHLFKTFLLIILAFSISLSSCDKDSLDPSDGTDAGSFGTVKGKFVSPSGKPISGVEVFIVNENKNLKSAFTVDSLPFAPPSMVNENGNLNSVFTDTKGEFTLEKVPVGKQKIKGVKGSFEGTFEVTVKKGKTETIKEVLINPINRLAHVKGEYDSIEDIIEGLGFSSESLDIYKDLYDPDKINFKDYSAIFLNCGAGVVFKNEVKTNLLNFLNDGGLIYASDWEIEAIESLFPEEIEYIGGGAEQAIVANVVDDKLIGNLGKDKINIIYDLDNWVEIISLSSDFKVIIEGDYKGETGPVRQKRPLAFSRKVGKGTVIFTTFHNERNITDDMKRILEEYIFF